MQCVVEEAKVLAGQLLLTPSQNSAESHTPAEARHTAVLLASAGHGALEPVQFSARSHAPADGRQTVALDLKVVHCAELFDVFVSIVVVETETLFVRAHEVSVLTVPLIVMVAEPPPFNVPRLQVTVCDEDEQVPLPLGFVFVQELDT